MTGVEFEAQFNAVEVPYNPANGYPAASDLFYQCRHCGDVFPSFPTHSISCSCGNFYVDVDAGRLGARKGDHTIRLLRGTPKS